VVGRIAVHGASGSGKSTLATTLSQRLALPRWTVMRRLLARTVRRGIVRRELWNGNRESLRNLFSTDA